MTKHEWQEMSARLAGVRPKYVTPLLFAADVALIVASWQLAAKGGAAWRFAAWITLQLALIHVYLILHEAIHHSVSSHRRLNDALGHWCGWLIALPFLPRQRNHLLHHVWAAHPTRDPENSKLIERFAVITKSEAAKVELLWRSWLPVIALNHIIATWRSPFVARRQGLKARRYVKESRWAFVYLAGYVGVAALLVATRHALFFLTWFVPPWLVLLMVVEMLNLPHHAEAPLLSKESEALPYWAQDSVSHDCGPVPFWSKFVILNFNLHIVHHYFPNVPWYALPRAERLLEERTGRAPVRNKSEFRWAIDNRRRPLLELMGHFFDKRTGAYENRRATIHGR